MDLLKSLYPPPEQRLPLPPLYTPTAYLFTILAWLLPTQGRILSTLPILSILVFLRPYFTLSSPIDNYNSGTLFIAWILGYLDFLVLSPAASEPEPRFYGPSKVEGAGGLDVYPDGTGIEDCYTFWSRIKFALRLTIFGRGIGWNWQVKNVPKISDAGKKKWVFIRDRMLFSALPAFGKKTLTVYLLGVAVALQQQRTESSYLLDVATGWLVAAWPWHSMKMLSDIAAAVSVAVGICDQWEWPPLFGELSELWSVRQAWSVVWHQLTRRTLNQPAILLTRFLGLKKGTLASRYTQLYLTFVFSLLMHWYLIFNAVGHDVGEFPFFILQPVAITVEDFVQYCWRQFTGRTKQDQLTTFERSIGLAWTIVWFSICLPPYAKGLIGARIAGYDAENILRLGMRHADEFLTS